MRLRGPARREGGDDGTARLVARMDGVASGQSAAAVVPAHVNRVTSCDCREVRRRSRHLAASRHRYQHFVGGRADDPVVHAAHAHVVVARGHTRRGELGQHVKHLARLGSVATGGAVPREECRSSRSRGCLEPVEARVGVERRAHARTAYPVQPNAATIHLVGEVTGRPRCCPLGVHADARRKGQRRDTRHCNTTNIHSAKPFIYDRVHAQGTLYRVRTARLWSSERSVQV